MRNIVIDTGERGTIITDVLPDLELNHHGQCFPLYWYERVEEGRLFDVTGVKVFKDDLDNRYIRHDGITDCTLEVFRTAYPSAFSTRFKKDGGPGINKEDIFYYVYGILHSPVYREKYASNLAKELPRIPLTRGFEEFSRAGRELARIHLGYESLEPWPTVNTGILSGIDPGRVTKMRWAKKRDKETKKMVPDHTKLIYNENVTISGIPEEAQGYIVNGRSPLDWMIDRYQVKTDKKSGITNDPNDYPEDPCYIIDLVGKLVRVSMETLEIVAMLPTDIEEIDHPDNWPVEWTGAN